jgi:hypothetical protein
VDTGKRLIYESGVIKKRRMWLERSIGECEEEMLKWVYEEIGTRKKMVKLGKLILGCKKEIEILQSLGKRIELKKRGQGEIELLIYGKKETATILLSDLKGKGSLVLVKSVNETITSKKPFKIKSLLKTIIEYKWCA